MVGADGEVVRRRPRLDLLVGAMGEAPVRETLDVSGEDWELILSGEMKLDETMLAHLETMTGAMGQAVEWWDEVEDEEDDGAGAPEDIGGVELDEESERPSEDVPAEALSSRSWNWGEHLEERRASLRAMHHLAMVTQYRLGVRYQGQLAMLGPGTKSFFRSVVMAFLRLVVALGWMAAVHLTLGWCRSHWVGEKAVGCPVSISSIGSLRPGDLLLSVDAEVEVLREPRGQVLLRPGEHGDSSGGRIRYQGADQFPVSGDAEPG